MGGCKWRHDKVAGGRVVMSPDDVIKWKHFPRYWPLWGEFTGHRWIPIEKASDAELWFFLSAPEQTVGQTIETPVIWDAIAPIKTSLKCSIRQPTSYVMPFWTHVKRFLDIISYIQMSNTIFIKPVLALRDNVLTVFCSELRACTRRCCKLCQGHLVTKAKIKRHVGDGWDSVDDVSLTI